MTTAPLYTAEAGFNLAAIMASAWATTRNAGRKATVEARRAAFAFNLRAAWNHAKNLRKYAVAAAARAEAEAQRAAVIAITPRADRLDRAAQLDRAAYGIDCADRNGSRSGHALRMEAAALRAA